MAYEDDDLEKEEADLSPIDDAELGNDVDAPAPTTQLPVDQDTEKELEASEDIAREELENMPLPQPAEEESIPIEAPSRLDRYQNFINEYRKLQDQRKNSDLVAGLMAAGGKIGQSIAGKYSGKFDPDLTGVQMMQQAANRPVTDLEQQQIVSSRGLQLQGLQNASDPKSPQSRLVRDYLRSKLGIELDDDVSAADAQMLIKTIGKPAQQKAGQIVRTFNPQTGQVELKVFDPTSMSLKALGETAGFAMQPRIDPRTGEVMVVNTATGQKQSNITGPSAAPSTSKEEVPIITRDNLTAAQQERLDKYRKDFFDDSKDDRAAINTAQGIKGTLQSGKNIDGDILRELQNQFARSSGEKGAMTENDVKEFGGRQAILDRIQRSLSMWTTGKIPEGDRKFLSAVADRMEKRAKGYVANRSDFFVNNMYQDLKSAPNLKGAAFTPASIKNLIGVNSAVNPVGNTEEKVKVRNIQTGQEGFIPKKNLKKALASKKYEEVK